MKLSERNENSHKPFFREFGNSITFTKLTECTPEAPQLAWKPSSLAYRKSQAQQERYFLSLYLTWRFAHEKDAVTPPLIITRGGGDNEPDFLVVENGIEYGLEVSRASTWMFQRAVAACSESGPFACVELTPRLNMQSRSEVECRANGAPFDAHSLVHPPGQPFFGDGWSGSSAESMLADAVACRLRAKLGKLREHYSNTVDICDLLLYSDIPIPTRGEVEHAVELLRQRIIEGYETSAASVSFRRVSVVCETWAIFDALGDKLKIVGKEGSPFTD
jgi:hypothetical protein